MSETILTTIDVDGQTFVPWSDYAAERAAREAAERARAHINAMYICALEDIERAEAECERLRSNVETLKELLGAAIRAGGEPAAQAVDALLASREDDAA